MNVNDLLGKVFIAFEGLMVLMYFLAGLYVFTTSRFDYIDSTIRNIFGFFLMAYGFFRLVRYYTKLKNLNNQ
jgi:uncharacterized membrane protein